METGGIRRSRELEHPHRLARVTGGFDSTTGGSQAAVGDWSAKLRGAEFGVVTPERGQSGKPPADGGPVAEVKALRGKMSMSISVDIIRPG
jgi:hypothetical protein